MATLNFAQRDTLDILPGFSAAAFLPSLQNWRFDAMADAECD
jgi:hypothetical protein